MIKNIKGTKDILPNETYQWRWIESIIHSIMDSYGYNEIRTPIFENTELFQRGIGEETDIVSKEMYTWTDQGGKSLTLRPELTAPVIRAYLQHNLQSYGPISRLYYIDSLFRRERPQAGRQRQFHQFGIEAIGSEFPEQDAECIAMAYNIYQFFGIKNLTVKINSIGSNDIRSKYLDIFRSSMKNIKSQLSPISQNRLDNNALRIFDSKNSDDQKLLDQYAPFIFDHISKNDLNHFNELLSILDNMKIPYIHDRKLVRGLDYYTRTTFEIVSSSLGSQDALCGGGRYDNLIYQLGGKPTPAIGFASGIERLIMILNSNTEFQIKEKKIIYIAVTGNDVINESLHISEKLRTLKEFIIILETNRRSLKAQLREANRKNSLFTIIIGKNEVNNKKVQIRNMKTSKQEEINIDKLKNYFLEQLTTNEK